jgi:cytochrome c-type biogenesis protein
VTETASEPGASSDAAPALGRASRRWLRPVVIGTASLVAAVVLALLTNDPTGGLNTFVESASGSSTSSLGQIGLLLPFGFAFAAGMASAANPCGFSLLPAYIGLLLSKGAGDSPLLRRRLGSAALIGIAVTAGFVVLFAAVGLLIGAGGSAITDIFPVVGLSVGIVLIGAGVYRLGGGLLYSAAPEQLSARMGAGSTGPKGYLLFGLTYGIASLSCTLPIFLAVLGGSLATASISDTLAQMVLYGLGMGLVITMLTIAVALFRESMQRWMKSAMRWVEPLGTIFLFVAGMYIVYYWLTIGGLLNS